MQETSSVMRRISGIREKGERGDFCIDTYRIYDSCREQNCFENLPVFLTDITLGRLGAQKDLQAKQIKILGVKLKRTSVPFQDGLIRIGATYYFSATLTNGTDYYSGLAIGNKEYCLYAGKSDTVTFRACVSENECSGDEFATRQTPLLVVLECAEPIPLCTEFRSFIPENAPNKGLEIPRFIADNFEGTFQVAQSPKGFFTVTVGLFSIIKTERKNSIVVPACDYCIPGAKCTDQAPSEDPCTFFGKMPFPMEEFYPDLRPGKPRLPHDAQNTDQ